MTDPFDELERGLRDRVRERAPQPARRSRWRRAPLLSVVVAALAASGVAVAASQIHFSHNDQREGESIANRVYNATFDVPACGLVRHTIHDRPRFTSATPIDAITDALPLLNRPETVAEHARTERLLRSDPRVYWQGLVVRGTLRSITALPGQHLLFFVQMKGFGTVRDPAACITARTRAAERLLRGKPDGVRGWTLKVLRESDDVDATAQLPMIYTEQAGCGARKCGWGGGGVALLPDSTSLRGRIRLGVQGWSSSMGRPDRYTGIASSQASRILVRPEHPSKLGPVPKSVKIHHNFWILDLPDNTGPVTLLEVDKSDHVLRRMTIRNRRAGA